MSNPQDAEGWRMAAAKVEYETALEKQAQAVPIRLEIASRILAGSETTVNPLTGYAAPLIQPEVALQFADALIKAHNATADASARGDE